MMMMMSSDDKTEDPTAYKLGKARSEGSVAKSTDFTAALLMGTVLMMLTVGGDFLLSSLKGLLKTLLSLPYQGEMTQRAFYQLLYQASQVAFLLLAPFLGALFFTALGSNLWQVKPMFNTKPIMPNISKLNPAKGIQRIFSMKGLVELFKGILKMVVVTSVGYAVVQSQMSSLLLLNYSTPAALYDKLWQLLLLLSGWMFATYLAIGLADYKYQHWQFVKNLKMTKQEVKDESKNLEGDTKMKGKVRQTGRAMLNKKQLKHIPTADVIITNPTHYAIALRYDPDIAPAPHVVAKGVDHFALKIREVGKLHNIEMVENRPLARALYDKVDYGEMIPPELFVAVAEVLAFVYQKKGKR
jgi:flagellar biosynthetic protein FlhB